MLCFFPFASFLQFRLASFTTTVQELWQKRLISILLVPVVSAKPSTSSGPSPTVSANVDWAVADAIAKDVANRGEAAEEEARSKYADNPGLWSVVAIAQLKNNLIKLFKQSLK